MALKPRLAASVGVVTLLLGTLFAVVLEADRVAATGRATWLPFVADSATLTVAVYDNFFMVVGFLLSPLLVFTVGYRYGRGSDLPREYRSVFGALVVGSFLGYGIGRTLAVVATIGFQLGAVVGVLVPVLFAAARVVFVGFAGVAVGYLRTSGLPSGPTR